MRPRTRSLFAAIALAFGTIVFVSAPAAHAAPGFQLPFPCNQTWHGNSSNSSAHQSWELDFNRGSSAGADKGDTVVAAAAGTVRTSSHQGSANGYGNLVKIEHSDGYFTYYAHLNTRAVAVGQTVSRGQSIGTVGNTSKPGNNISPHLHFEVRKGSSYPSNIQKAVFNGSTFPYPDASVKSANCSTAYDPAGLCGSGYQVIDTARLSDDGAVDLLWNGGSQSNCVVTLKFTAKGTPTATSAYLEPQGAARKTDSGNYGYYAGPVRASAPTCVKWGGSTGGSSYNSPSEHC